VRFRYGGLTCRTVSDHCLGLSIDAWKPYRLPQEDLCLCDFLMCLMDKLKYSVLKGGGNDDSGALEYDVIFV